MTEKKVGTRKEYIRYPLGRWGVKYILERAMEFNEFFCFECWKGVKGVSMYEHWVVSHPKSLEELNKDKRRRWGHVKQEPSGYLDSFGPGTDPQERVLFPFPGEAGKSG